MLPLLVIAGRLILFISVHFLILLLLQSFFSLLRASLLCLVVHSASGYPVWASLKHNERNGCAVACHGRALDRNSLSFFTTVAITNVSTFLLMRV